MSSVRSARSPVARPGSCYRRELPRHPIERALVRRFDRALDELWAMAAPISLLDVGCGEGGLTERWASRLGDGRAVGVDVAAQTLEVEWRAREGARNLE